jgi:hypothetical protein
MRLLLVEDARLWTWDIGTHWDVRTLGEVFALLSVQAK